MDQSAPEQQSRFNDPITHRGLSWPKTIVVLLVLGGLGFGTQRYIIENKPEARKFTPPRSLVAVEAEAPGLKTYPVKISTNGTVTAATRGNLVAQVSGEITSVSSNFVSGGRFKKGEILLEIDSRNYSSAISNASANFSQAKANLEQQEAEAEQALKEWQRLGFDGEPSDLVLRKPQVATAKAQLESAEAALEKAKLDFSRTQVRAPYDGSLISKRVAIGQFVSVGNVIGEIFSNQGLEVQLPLNQTQYAQLNVSEQPEVLLSAELAGKNHNWPAQIVRSDSVFNTTTRQLNVTAKIAEAVSDKGLRLKIGQYVNASIKGRVVEDAVVLANQSIREGSFVYLFDNGILRKRNINILWQDDENAIVEGVGYSEKVVLTSLGGTVNGASARLLNEDGLEPAQRQRSASGSLENAGNDRGRPQASPERRQQIQKIREELGIAKGEKPTPEQRQKIREMMQAASRG